MSSRIGKGVAAAALGVALAHAAAAQERPLQTQLEARTAESRATMPAEVQKLLAGGVEAVRQSGLVEKAPKVGDQAKPFALPDAQGNRVRLAELLERGPVVLTWYRGGWCPYCNLALQGLAKAEPRLRELGATVVAVTPELPEFAAQTAKKDGVAFTVLSDAGNKVARDYGLVFKLSEPIAATYKQFGIDLAKSNGDGSNELPLSATFVIDRDGTIRYAFVDADYKKRAEPADVVAAVAKLRR